MKVVLSYGLGEDSTAILLRWLEEPESRDFPLDDLIVLIAQVGHEFPDIKQNVEAHIFPRLREHNIRTVQIARGGPGQAEGIVILDDTHQPTTLYIDGHYTLGEELLLAGTVPQYASGQRRCSIKFKGWVLDTWKLLEFGGEAYRHIIGFNDDEIKRVERDKGYGSANRQVEYPLVSWGWDRAGCQAYIAATTGVEAWGKSCCAFCPFASGNSEMLARYRTFPDAGGYTLFMEFVALAFNPRMTLYAGGRTAWQAITGDENTAALANFEERLNATAWGIYRVRRRYYGVGRADRSVELLHTGNHAEAMATLLDLAYDRHLQVAYDNRHARIWIHRKDEVDPPVEEFYVVAPAVVANKARGRFERAWAQAQYKQPAMF